MTETWIAVVEACTAASDAGRMPFPNVVAALAEAGVERYHADLVRAEKTYYLPDGSSHVVASMPLGTPPAATFVPDQVAAAVRAAQAGEVDYQEFCRRIAAAGCADYHVSLAGRRAVYQGRTAEAHVEHFPD